MARCAQTLLKPQSLRMNRVPLVHGFKEEASYEELIGEVSCFVRWIHRTRSSRGSELCRDHPGRELVVFDEAS